MAHQMLRFAAGTDIGRRGPVNEDSAFAGPRLLAVADGMGGHPHGDVASRTAITTLAALPQPATALAAGVAEVAARLDDIGRQDPELSGTGTTLTAMAWDGDRFTVAHIGDSRAYLLRAGDLIQITRDHTMAQSPADGDRPAPGAAARSPKGAVLLRALQSGSSGEPEMFEHDALTGDRYLLCSDGLSNHVSPQQIHDVMVEPLSPAEVVERLIALAGEAGGADDVTCVVADVLRIGTLPEQEPVTVGAAAVPEPGLLARIGRRLRRA